MKNLVLQDILDSYKSKNNKELANMLLILESDFNNMKDVIIALTESLKELEETYDLVYQELQNRLKFKEDES